MTNEPNPRMDFGPQYARDNAFAARMRFHQSWYRSKILKAPYGTGPKQSNATWFGNMLTREDGERGLNFLSPHIFEVAKRRLELKKGTIDPFRLYCNMLSSQPMCFNLFGPLVDNPQSATRLAQTILPGEIQAINKVMLEFAPDPASSYLNDRTAFDAFITFVDQNGQPGFLGVETRLVEAFSAKEYRSPRYNELTQSPNSPWPEEAWPHLSAEDINQLWRDHLLALAMQTAPGAKFGAGHFLLVYHPQDQDCIQALEKYRRCLKPDDRSFLAIPLDELVERWRQVAVPAEKQWLDDFSLRYLDLQASEADFLAEKKHR